MFFSRRRVELINFPFTYRSSQGLEGEKVIKEYLIYALIPESTTSPTAVAARSGSQVRKQ